MDFKIILYKYICNTKFYFAAVIEQSRLMSPLKFDLYVCMINYKNWNSVLQEILDLIIIVIKAFVYFQCNYFVGDKVTEQQGHRRFLLMCDLDFKSHFQMKKSTFEVIYNS